MPRPGLSAEARVLIATQALFNLGFYAIVPFLVVALRDDYGQSAAAIGVILGARTLSQQGMFLVGGVLADRFGSRGMIVIGCLTRALGFGTLLMATGFGLLLVGAILTGLAGALFSPALEARLSYADDGRRGTSAFVWLMSVGEIGALLGPLLGSLLMGRGFHWSLMLGVVLFLGVGFVLGLYLQPGHPHAARAAGARAEVEHEEAGERRGPVFTPRFIMFCVLASGNLLAYNQLYFIYPLALDRGGVSLTGPLFAGVSLLTIATQVPIHRLLARWRPEVAVRLGFLLLLVAFVLPALTGVYRASVLASAGLLAIGHLILTPTHQREALRHLSDPRRRGAHLGLLATCGGIAVMLGNTALGRGLDVFGVSSPVVWGGFAAAMVAPALLLPGRLADSVLREFQPVKGSP